MQRKISEMGRVRGKIEEGIPIRESLLTDDLLKELVDTEDITMFHLIMNHIGKTNASFCSEVMDKKKAKYDKLLKTFNVESGLFERDEELLSIVRKRGEIVHKRETSHAVLDNLSEEYVDKIPYYLDFEEIIRDAIYDNKSFDEILSKLKSEQFEGLDPSIVEEYYKKYKEAYDIYDSYCSEANELYDKISAIIDERYNYETNHKILISLKDVDAIEKIIKEENKQLIKDMVISYFFEDTPVNFFANLENMVDFQTKVDTKFIKPEMLNVYLSIIRAYREDDLGTFINLFNKLKEMNIDFKAEFYDNFTDARKLCAQMLMDSVYRVDENSSEYVVEDGVKCYSLTGEPFYMMIHGSDQQITDFQTGIHDGTSMSFISGDRLNVYEEGIIYGFDSLDPKQFVELYPKDTATEYDIGAEKISLLDAVPRYYTPEEFIKETPDALYNEIVYLTGNKDTPQIVPPKPSYIVCLDKPNSESIEIAKKLQIPIVIIKTEFYPKINKNNLGSWGFLGKQQMYRGF